MKVDFQKSLIENYSVLSQGDIIGLTYFENTLYFDILGTFPSSSIIVNNTDLEVDFEKPLDYKEPPVQEEKIEPVKRELQKARQDNEDQKELNKGFVAFSGKGNRLGDK